MKKEVQEKEQGIKKMHVERHEITNSFQEEKMDMQMEEMTVHNLRNQNKEMDEKVTKLLTPEV